MRASMMSAFLALMLLACTIECGLMSGPSTSLPPGVVAIEYGYLNGKAMPFIVTEQEIGKSPDWNDGQSPPLSIEQAIQAASKELAQDVPDPTGWRLLAVRLEKVESCGGYTPTITVDRKWYYVVEFYSKSKTGNTGYVPNSFRIPVLLNGQAIRANKGS